MSSTGDNPPPISDNNPATPPTSPPNHFRTADRFISPATPSIGDPTEEDEAHLDRSMEEDTESLYADLGSLSPPESDILLSSSGAHGAVASLESEFLGSFDEEKSSLPPNHLQTAEYLISGTTSSEISNWHLTEDDRTLLAHILGRDKKILDKDRCSMSAPESGLPPETISNGDLKEEDTEMLDKDHCSLAPPESEIVLSSNGCHVPVESLESRTTPETISTSDSTEEDKVLLDRSLEEDTEILDCSLAAPKADIVLSSSGNHVAVASLESEFPVSEEKKKSNSPPNHDQTAECLSGIPAVTISNGDSTEEDKMHLDRSMEEDKKIDIVLSGDHVTVASPGYEPLPHLTEEQRTELESILPSDEELNQLTYHFTEEDLAGHQHKLQEPELQTNQEIVLAPPLPPTAPSSATTDEPSAPPSPRYRTRSTTRKRAKLA